MTNQINPPPERPELSREAKTPEAPKFNAQKIQRRYDQHVEVHVWWLQCR